MSTLIPMLAPLWVVGMLVSALFVIAALHDRRYPRGTFRSAMVFVALWPIVLIIIGSYTLREYIRQKRSHETC